MSLLDRLFSLLAPAGSAGGVRRVEPDETARLVREKKAVLVDVREPGEWAGGFAQEAVLLSFSDLTGPRQQWRPFLGPGGKTRNHPLLPLGRALRHGRADPRRRRFQGRQRRQPARLASRRPARLQTRESALIVSGHDPAAALQNFPPST